MRRRSRGQSMVEMALVLPFLLFVVLGIVEVSYYVYTYTELENATRRASERVSKTPPLSTTNPNDPNDKCAQLAEVEAIRGAYLNDLVPSNITFSFPQIVGSDGNWRPGERKYGDQVEVEINYSTSFLTPIAGQFFGDVLEFQFRSRRTITSVGSPRGLDDRCAPL